MSSIHWQNGHIVQRVGNNEEELGHLELDPNSNTHVLWLKDTCNVFSATSATTSYVRGDEFSSLEEAKIKVMESVSAGLFHLMWLFSLKKKHPNNSEIKERYEKTFNDIHNGQWYTL